MIPQPHEHDGSGRQYLKTLLSIRNQYPDRAGEIDEMIRSNFEREVAILVLDMCGFSRRTIEQGIIAYLALIAQMETVAGPAVEGNGGTVIKQEADNLFAIFETSADAVEAASDIIRGFEAVNSALPDERDLQGCFGIGFGATLVIDEADLFGAEMNLASKLGEDLAKASEVLITPDAYAGLPRERYLCSPATYEISGLDITCYRLDRIVRKGTTQRLG